MRGIAKEMVMRPPIARFYSRGLVPARARKSKSSEAKLKMLGALLYSEANTDLGPGDSVAPVLKDKKEELCGMKDMRS